MILLSNQYFFTDYLYLLIIEKIINLVYKKEEISLLDFIYLVEKLVIVNFIFFNNFFL